VFAVTGACAQQIFLTFFFLAYCHIWLSTLIYILKFFHEKGTDWHTQNTKVAFDEIFIVMPSRRFEQLLLLMMAVLWWQKNLPDSCMG
jgi:hypothetical protein